jgi:hypothetical protein
LSRAYSEKIAASLAREGLTTAVDAMNYLRRIYRPKDKEKLIVTPKNAEITESAEIKNKEKESSSKHEPSWEEMIDDLDGGGSDGKA